MCSSRSSGSLLKVIRRMYSWYLLFLLRRREGEFMFTLRDPWDPLRRIQMVLFLSDLLLLRSRQKRTPTFPRRILLLWDVVLGLLVMRRVERLRLIIVRHGSGRMITMSVHVERRPMDNVRMLCVRWLLVMILKFRLVLKFFFLILVERSFVSS